MRRYLPFLFIALIGCKPNPGSYLVKAPPAHAVMGWKTHSPSKFNFNIALPQSYEPFDMSAFGKLGKGSSSSGIERLFGASKGEEKGVETFALASMQEPVMGLLMVIQQDHGHNVTRGGEMAGIEERLTRGSFKLIDKSEMDLPVGKASRIVAEMAAGGLTMRSTVYVLVDGHYSYHFLFTGLTTDGAKIPTKQIMRTFRVTKLSPRS